ncbi:Ff.00g066730.m01.CDS01 [Fusarium sp. VM40]|nr:Ff.00g066730.m01.CDS01 [Fusarium sp. VM40]
MNLPTIPRLFIVALICFTTQVAADVAQPAGLLEDSAQCAISCLTKLLGSPVFSPANKELLCSDKDLSDSVTDCVRKACTVRELLDFLNSEQRMCGRPDLDNDHNIRAINFLILGIAVAAVTLRIVSKAYRFTRWGADDYLIIAAAVFTAIQCSIMIAMTYEGLGHNIWTLDDSSITKFLTYLIVVEIAYVLSLYLLKVSILWFFYRTFPSVGFQRIVIWTIVFNTLSAVCICVSAGFQSFPKDPTQERWKDESSRRKVDVQALAFAHAGINVGLDIWMFVLPLTQLYHIGLKTRKKIGVILIFGVGIFLIVVSCLRIPFMIDFNGSLNATADSQGIVIWSNLESGVGILVACLPHTQPLLRATMMRVRSMELFSRYSGDSQGIFISRPLATIDVTRLDGTTVINSDDIILNDTGGLLTVDKNTSLEEGDQKPDSMSVSSITGRDARPIT